MPLDPTQLNSEDIPLKKLPDASDFIRKEKKGKNPERIEF